MSFTKMINREPAMVIAGALCVFSLALPYAVVPVRKSLGLSTHQWDNDPATHPMLNWHGDDYKTHVFDDAKKLAAWSQLPAYRCVGAGAHVADTQRAGGGLTPPPPPPIPLVRRYNAKRVQTERDFPEARARAAPQSDEAAASEVPAWGKAARS
jgi:hypothetical protein